jgi:hypothetical protein
MYIKTTDAIKILLRSAISFCWPNTNIINTHTIIPIIIECNIIIQCSSILYTIEKLNITKYSIVYKIKTRNMKGYTIVGEIP